MHRSDWLLLFLAAPPGGPVDPIRVQKGLFLLAMSGELSPAERYSFEPYLYGPMSRDVYRDLRSLVEDGFAEPATAEAGRWRPTVATTRGVAAAERAESYAQAERSAALEQLRSIRLELDRLSFADLLRHVYERHPEYARKSVFRS